MIGGAQSDMTIGQAYERQHGKPMHPSLRYDYDIYELHDEYTDKQLRGYWWLLGQWLKLNPMPGVTKDDLHEWCCMKHFGYFEKQYPDGSVEKKPIQTLTKSWNAERNRYYRTKRTLAQIEAHITWVYVTAAEGGLTLPEMKKEYARAA